MAGQNMIAMAALEVAGLAFLIVIVSMATDYWAHQNSQKLLRKESYWYGLWKDYRYSRNNYRWLKATQAAVCLDFIANLGGVVALGLLTFVKSLPEKVTKLLALVLMGVAIFSSFFAIVVFGAEKKTDLGWSWGILISAAILQIVSLVLTIFVKRSEEE